MANEIFAAVVKQSKRYGLKLNEKKCEVIAVNTRGKKDTIRFPTGEEMKQVSSATYLGGQLRKDGAARPEVESRLSRAAVTFRKLTPLWRDAACEKR